MTATPIPAHVHATLLRARRQLLLAVPFYAAVLAGLAFLAQRLAGPLDWKVVGLGALGWLVALMLRGPVSAVAVKVCRTKEAAQTVVAGASGPLEEGVRLALLLWLMASWPIAVAVGLGWAAIEVVFAVVNGFAANVLLSRDDPKAQEARAVLEAQGLLRDTGAHWGVIERVFASLAHMGFTFLAAANPLWLLVTIPAHTGMNLGVVTLARRSIARAEGALAIVGLALFLAGLAALGHL